jgi:hypothetical protein
MMSDTFNSGIRRKGRRPAEDQFQEEAPESTISRADMRAPMRDEDPRTRAARRAAEIRGHRGPMDEGTDEFYIDPAMIPDGWTYEWKRRFLVGQEDASHLVQLRREGWEPVPCDRDAIHKGYMPANWDANTIERKGMILMERPSELTEEVREMQYRNARKQVRDKEAQLAGTPDGTMTRDHEKVRPNIKKSFEAMPIPKD